MVELKAFAEAAENGNGVGHGGRGDEHGLEAALEGGVFLDVFTVFVEGGGADAVEFAAGEHGLEEVAGIHGAFGLAGADDGVEFVDEKDDAAPGGFDLGEDSFEAFLEFAAVFGAGDEGAPCRGRR